MVAGAGMTGLRLLLTFAMGLTLSGSALAWDHWGGDIGGLRFSDAAQINSSNVTNLIRAWISAPATSRNGRPR